VKTAKVNKLVLHFVLLKTIELTVENDRNMSIKIKSTDSRRNLF